MSFANIPHSRTLPDRYRTRLAIGATLSLVIHGLLLLLEFGIPGIGLPGMALPWDERRAQPVDLTVRLTSPQLKAPQTTVPAQVANATTPSSARLRHSKKNETAAKPSIPLRADAARTIKAVPPSAEPRIAKSAKPAPSLKQSHPTPRKSPTPKPEPQKTQPKPITQMASSDEAFAVMPIDPDVRAQAPSIESKAPEQPADAVPEPEKGTTTPEPTVPPAIEPPAVAPPRIEPLPVEPKMPELPELKHATDTVPQQAPVAETPSIDDTMEREALAQEMRAQATKAEQAEQAARDEAAALQKQQQEQLKQERERQEAAQHAQELEEKKLAEIKKQEQAEREALELVAHNKAEEEKRQQAALLAKKTRERELAARQEAAKQAAAQQREQARIAQENARSSAVPGGDSPVRVTPLARDLFGGGLASRALEQARRPDLLRVDPSNTRSSTNDMDNSRRRSVFGSIDRDVGLTMYIEGWRRKIERNGSLNYAQSSRDKMRGEPIVTVAIRSDGSVEEVVINRSSGLPELDEAVRRIVQLNARYAIFPPALARKYDVIEIRHIWNFDDILRILEEVR